MADRDPTLPATPRRRQQAREEGKTVYSVELTSVATWLIGGTVLVLMGGIVARTLVALARRQLGGEPWLVTGPGVITQHWNATAVELATTVLPVLAAVAAATAAAGLAQTGARIFPSRLRPDVGRLDPVRGLARIFSSTSGARLTLGVARAAAVAAVACWSLAGRRETLLELVRLDAARLGPALAAVVATLGLQIGLALFFFAAIDYAWQWWRHERQLRMTPEELRQEFRESEGDPQVRSRRRAWYRGQGSKGATGDLLVVGHDAAVGISYQTESTDGGDAAPRVVATARGSAAARLRREAELAGRPVVERPELARELTAQLSAGAEVPRRWWETLARAIAACSR